MSKSLTRALRLLELIVYGGEPRGLMELAAQSGYDKSTTLRVLRALQDHRFVTRDPHSKLFSVGPGLLSLASAALQRSDLLGLVRPYLHRLREATSETVALHLRLGDERVCVDKLESTEGLMMAVPLGQAIPLYEGSAAKAILAFLPPQEIERILAKAELDRDKEERIRPQLDGIRRRGYFVARNDRLQGVGTISVPLFDASGVTGSITVAGPIERWSEPKMAAFAPSMVEMVSQVSAAMGGVTPVWSRRGRMVARGDVGSD